MRDCLFRKGLVIGIIALLIGVSVIPGISGNIKTTNKVVYEDVINDRIEDIRGLIYDDRGYIINNHLVRKDVNLINTYDNGPGEINPIWITVENLGYFFSMKVYEGYIHAVGPVESNSPPGLPTISGETNGKIREEYEYTLRVVDPDNNPVRFYIDWGDGDEGWTSERASGEKSYFEHTWYEEGDYKIRVKAQDVLGEESDWVTLEVTMPRNRAINWFFLKVLEQFPILQYLLRL